MREREKFETRRSDGTCANDMGEMQLSVLGLKVKREVVFFMEADKLLALTRNREQAGARGEDGRAASPRAT